MSLLNLVNYSPRGENKHILLETKAILQTMASLKYPNQLRVDRIVEIIKYFASAVPCNSPRSSYFQTIITETYLFVCILFYSFIILVSMEAV